ncbi:MAG: ABC transporter ATP-binding protein [Micropruina sp.]|uniref:ABC transporter ATP-binding protein n=1 Tax=Micropruina sp. TaxID=2737536 RepID=UPI0039E36870
MVKEFADMTSERAVAIELSDVSFTYRRRKRMVTALQSFSAEVGRGEVVALLGQSGSGKSTVLSLVAGLEIPAKGTVRVLGTNVGELDARGRAQFRLEHIAHIYQDYRLLPMLTAVDNVAFVLRLKGMAASEARTRSESALDAVGIGHRLDHRPAELSGGEQQRVSIARALVAEPDILLADEPTGSLDADRRDEILDLMLSSLQGTTMVLVTHDPEVAGRANRVVTLT